MKRHLGLIALAAGVIGLFCGGAFAAQTCQRSDFFCYESGPSQNLSTPARLDASGNLSVLASSMTGQTTFSGLTVANPVNIVSVATTTILTPTAGFNRILSTGGAVTIIGFSTAATIADGTYVIIGATADINAVTITSGTSSATGVGLGAATRTIDSKGKLGLIYDAFGNIWRELWYSVN